MQTLLGATLGEADIGGLVHSPIAVAPIGYAQRLAGMRAAGSRGSSCARPGAASAKCGRRCSGSPRPRTVNLEPSNFDSRLFAVAVAPESKSEALFSGISALVGLHVRAERDAGHRALAAQADRRRTPARRDPLDDRPDPAVRRRRARCAGLRARARARGRSFDRRLPRHPRLSLVRVPRRATSASSPGRAWRSPSAPGWLPRSWGCCGRSARSLRARCAARSVLGSTPRGWTAARLAIGVAVPRCYNLDPHSSSTEAALVGNVALVVALVCLLPSLFDGLVSALRARLSASSTAWLRARGRPSFRLRRRGCARWRSPRPPRWRCSASSSSRARRRTSNAVWMPPRASSIRAPRCG